MGKENGGFQLISKSDNERNLLYLHQTIKDAKTDSSVVGIIIEFIWIISTRWIKCQKKTKIPTPTHKSYISFWSWSFKQIQNPYHILWITHIKQRNSENKKRKKHGIKKRENSTYLSHMMKEKKTYTFKRASWSFKRVSVIGLNNHVFISIIFTKQKN